MIFGNQFDNHRTDGNNFEPILDRTKGLTKNSGKKGERTFAKAWNKAMRQSIYIFVEYFLNFSSKEVCIDLMIDWKILCEG